MRHLMAREVATGQKKATAEGIVPCRGLGNYDQYKFKASVYAYFLVGMLNSFTLDILLLLPCITETHIFMLPSFSFSSALTMAV